MPTVPMTGTFTKPTTGIIGTSQPSTYTIGTATQQQQQTPQMGLLVVLIELF